MASVLQHIIASLALVKRFQLEILLAFTLLQLVTTNAPPTSVTVTPVRLCPLEAQTVLIKQPTVMASVLQRIIAFLALVKRFQLEILLVFTRLQAVTANAQPINV